MVVTQTQPQFIRWVREEGVFKPAELDSSDHLRGCRLKGYDLTDHTKLEEGEISPSSLSLVSSIYLGPINVSEKDLLLQNIVPRDYPRSLAQHRYQTINGILDSARRAADERDVQYFAVEIIRAKKDVTSTFPIDPPFKFFGPDSYESGQFLGSKKDILGDLEGRPINPTEFILHPTAQLYVPRE